MGKDKKGELSKISIIEDLAGKFRDGVMPILLSVFKEKTLDFIPEKFSECSEFLKDKTDIEKTVFAFYYLSDQLSKKGHETINIAQVSGVAFYSEKFKLDFSFVVPKDRKNLLNILIPQMDSFADKFSKVNEDEALPMYGLAVAVINLLDNYKKNESEILGFLEKASFFSKIVEKITKVDDIKHTLVKALSCGNNVDGLLMDVTVKVISKGNQLSEDDEAGLKEKWVVMADKTVALFEGIVNILKEQGDEDSLSRIEDIHGMQNMIKDIKGALQPEKTEREKRDNLVSRFADSGGLEVDIGKNSAGTVSEEGDSIKRKILKT